MTAAKDSGDHWSFDRKIPLAVIMALFVQTAGMVWWVSKQESRITALEQSGTTGMARLDANDKAVNDSAKSIARIEERQQAAIDTSKRIEAKIDKLADQLLQPVPRGR